MTMGAGKEHFRWREPKFKDSQPGMNLASVRQEQARVVRA